jgi:hypothetical protein
VVKYISKNVDGYGIEADESGLEAPKAAGRVKTWSTAWGIRQFRFSGGPPVSVWRELRLLRDEVAIQTRLYIWRVKLIGFDSSCGSNFEIYADQAGNHLEFCQ